MQINICNFRLKLNKNILNKNQMKTFIKKILEKKGIEIKKLKNLDDSALYLELYGEESVKNRRFYNICAGGHFEFGCAFKHPLWTHVDVDRKWNGVREYNPATDIAHDPYSLKPYPIESDTAELVHSRFAVEHIPNNAAQLMFNEIHRILKKGGIARFTCPHTDLAFRAYKNNDRNYFFWLNNHAHFKNASMEQIFVDHVASSASTLHKDGSQHRITDEEFQTVIKSMPYEQAMDYITSKCDLDFQLTNRRNHLNWWNFKKFEKMLSEAGFNEIYLSQPYQSFSPVMRNENYFDSIYNRILIYVEVRK